MLFVIFCEWWGVFVLGIGPGLDEYRHIVVVREVCGLGVLYLVVGFCCGHVERVLCRVGMNLMLSPLCA